MNVKARTLDVLFIKFALQPFSLEQLEACATAYLPAADLVYGVHLLQRDGIVHTASRGWREKVYMLSLGAFLTHQQKKFVSLGEDLSSQGRVTLLKEAKPVLAYHLLRTLSAIAKGELPLTAQGKVQQRALHRFTESLQLASADLAGLRLNYPEREHYPPSAAVLLDLALSLGLISKTGKSWTVNEALLLRWLKYTPSEMDDLLMSELIARYVPARAILQHAVCALLHPAYEAGEWGSLEGLISQIESATAASGRNRQEDLAWLIAWLKALCGFGWMELGYAEAEARKDAGRESEGAADETSIGELNGETIDETFGVVIGSAEVETRGEAMEEETGLPDKWIWPDETNPSGERILTTAGLKFRWLRKPHPKDGAGIHFLTGLLTDPSTVIPKRPSGSSETISSGLFVQPDYEILVPPDTSYAVRWELELFCELASADVMTTYRLTQKSVETALIHGRSQEELLCFLERHALTGVPDSIARTLRQWASANSRISWMETTLLCCADEKTANRIDAEPAAGEALERIGPRHFILKTTELSSVSGLLEQCGVASGNKAGNEAARPANVYPRLTLLEDMDSESERLPATGSSSSNGPDNDGVHGLDTGPVSKADFSAVNVRNRLDNAQRTGEIELPESWINEGKPFRPAVSVSPVPDFEDLFPGLRNIPLSWTREIKGYHASTVKLLFQQALEWKAGVELKLKNHSCAALPRWIKGGGEWTVGVELAVEPEAGGSAKFVEHPAGALLAGAASIDGILRKGAYMELHSADIQGIRIILPDRV